MERKHTSKHTSKLSPQSERRLRHMLSPKEGSAMGMVAMGGIRDFLLSKARELIQAAETLPTDEVIKEAIVPPMPALVVNPDVVFNVGPLEIDLEFRVIRLGGKELDFKHMERDVVIYLARRAGQVVPRAELITKVWRQSPDAHGHSYATIINNIQRKMKEYGLEGIVETVPRKGFVLHNSV